MMAEAKLLRQHKGRLEARMQILEDHNRQLEAQLQRLRQLLDEVSGFKELIPKRPIQSCPKRVIQFCNKFNTINFTSPHQPNAKASTLQTRAVTASQLNTESPAKLQQNGHYTSEQNSSKFFLKLCVLLNYPELAVWLGMSVVEV